MRKQYKLKSYTKRNRFLGGRRRSMGSILLGIILTAALVFLGISIYPPVYRYITGQTTPTPLPEPEPPSSIVSTAPENTLEPEISVPDLIPELQPVRGIVLPLETAGNPEQLSAFLKDLPPEINTIYLIVKDAQGRIYYQSALPQVATLGASGELAVSIPQLKEQLGSRQLAVQLSVFSDPILARSNLEVAIMHSSGVIWIDNTLEAGGKPWTTPYSPSARGYNTALITELVEQGADVIVLDHLMFPSDPTKSAVVSEVPGVSRQQILQQFVQEATAAAGDCPIYLRLSAADLQTPESPANEVHYGGDPAKLSEHLLLDIGAGDVPPALGRDQIFWITSETADLPKNEQFVLNIRPKA